VSLTPLSFDLPVVLVENSERDRKEELLKLPWPDSCVGEVLPAAIE
jgi:hypothetical protein